MKRVLSGVLLFVIAMGVSSCRSEVASESVLPTLYPVPVMTLVRHDSVEMSLDSLNGAPSVFAFIFTRCGGTCPLMVQSMKSVAANVPAESGTRFVMVSVDPEYDTPDVLNTYREKIEVDDRWIFLTGTVEQINQLSVDGFKLAATRPDEGAEPLLHSTRFVLVDDAGSIRAYYDATSDEELRRLEADISGLETR